MTTGVSCTSGKAGEKCERVASPETGCCGACQRVIDGTALGKTILAIMPSRDFGKSWQPEAGG
jgi:hypothetical protein